MQVLADEKTCGEWRLACCTFIMIVTKTFDAFSVGHGLSVGLIHVRVELQKEWNILNGAQVVVGHAAHAQQTTHRTPRCGRIIHLLACFVLFCLANPQKFGRGGLH